jgi:hypothetical protein
MMIHEFKIGELVKIRTGIDDPDLPTDKRVGLIVGKHTPTDLSTWDIDDDEYLWDVNINGKTLRFNEHWMKPFTESD